MTPEKYNICISIVIVNGVDTEFFTGDDMKGLSTEKMVNGIIKTLTVLATVIILFGLMLAACLKIESVSSIILPLYPRYNLALEGIKILQADPQPIKRENEIYINPKTNKPIMVTILGIDNPSWSVILDFIKSEIAFRKSDRNQPVEEILNIEDQSDDNQNVTHKSKLSEINYNRIKTIFVVRVRDVMKVGGKPLTEPYRALIFEPSQKKLRRVYDFLSFEEFKFDIKKMLVGELELYSYVLAIIAVLCNIALYCIRKYFKAYLNS